ncbi:MAG: DinB family protein [Anaerolineales bacterium]|nr:DinB family protein [Anaerolineales bacterium]
MNFDELFRQRYDVLYDFWLEVVWTDVSETLMRRRPHPHVNSIAWNLWHMARVEDAGLNRFVTDHPQVWEEGWMEKLNLPWRHHGSEMTFLEVDDLNERINLSALHDYANAVHARTLGVLETLNLDNLAAVVPTERIWTIMVEEGLAHSNPDVFIQTYTGWSKGKCLMNFCLTHPYQHIGEIGVIASLLGIAT